MTATQQKIRNDGKPARTPRLGSQPNSLTPVLTGPVGEALPQWHDLVSPGPKGDVEKKLARLAAVRHGVFETIPTPSRGQVRAGKFTPRTSPRVLQQFPSQRIRPVKGSRTPGFVEVRVGNSRARMAATRRRPVAQVTA